MGWTDNYKTIDGITYRQRYILYQGMSDVAIRYEWVEVSDGIQEKEMCDQGKD